MEHPPARAGEEGAIEMTKTEAIKKLATEVMGWELFETVMRDGKTKVIYLDDKETGQRMGVYRHEWVQVKCFDPYANSADCDALIEAFFTKNDAGFRLCPNCYNNGMQSVWISISWIGHGYWETQIEGEYTTAKKNEAVCEAILKAIEEAK
jgi:hypothetical protein